MVEKRVV
jgi:hypothetical protein